MKKILFILLSMLIFIPSIKAFDINLDELQINRMDTFLNDNISYKIEAIGYEQVSEYDENVQKITRELIKLSLANNSESEKFSSFKDYAYYDDESGFSTLSSNLFLKFFVKKISE